MTQSEKPTLLMVSQEKAIVVVTGFGPFSQYLVNLSWQAAQGLETLGLGEDVIVYARELPVHYTNAQELIAHIWKTIKPKLAVHMGIAPGSKAVILEQCGNNQGYRQRDVCGVCPPGHWCVEGGQNILHSIIDMKTLTRHFKSLGWDVIYSRDAGRFLCDFVYYYSLHLGGGKSVFLHLPTRGALADLDKLLPLLQAVILAMLSQLEAQ
ncbi:pyroglutamyl-peptidase 1-like isoform X1 [Brienomyrus brachyistius]|uniref:pyroglutamyl-peptidase 1-like isoform X1 n=1 Tax=Brienomyrus brachyistius TaxID=42636 RepID=UPI0020B38EA2|nr:pyroglutamyl-peptidase 1-like isoform X1 [Brienomyrus brachyistius]